MEFIPTQINKVYAVAIPTPCSYVLDAPDCVEIIPRMKCGAVGWGYANHLTCISLSAGSSASAASTPTAAPPSTENDHRGRNDWSGRGEDKDHSGCESW